MGDCSLIIFIEYFSDYQSFLRRNLYFFLLSWQTSSSTSSHLSIERHFKTWKYLFPLLRTRNLVHTIYRRKGMFLNASVSADSDRSWFFSRVVSYSFTGLFALRVHRRYILRKHHRSATFPAQTRSSVQFIGWSVLHLVANWASGTPQSFTVVRRQ